MNSSTRPATESAAARLEPIPPFLPFPYASVGPVAGPPEAFYGSPQAAAVAPDFRAEAEDRERSAHLLGVQEGQASARKECEEQLGRARSGVAEALAGFRRDRAAYFETVEGEVVQLALSIAAKIMHREAQIDPLLLAGMVRVALEKIERGTGIVLRVHPEKAFEWRGYFAAHMPPEDNPEIVEDAALGMDECILQTAAGTAVLGTEVQLKEIERGLMDLLAARPGTAQ
jgi:flagellar assembly protein FliH